MLKAKLIEEIESILLKNDSMPVGAVKTFRDVVLRELDQYDLKRILVRWHRRQRPRFTYKELAERYFLTERQCTYMCRDIR